MKKALCLILALAFSMTLLAGCGPQQTSGTQPPNGNTDTPPQVEKLAYELSKPGQSTESPPAIKASKKWKIGVTIPHLANAHFVAMAYGLEHEAEALGVEVIINEAGGYSKLPVQVQQFEDFLALPVDAIILVAIDADGTVPLVEKANEAKIPVINVNVLTASDDVVCKLRSDDYDLGRIDAEYMVKELDGKGNVLMLCGPPATSFINDRVKGFKDYIAANAPDMKILAEKYFDNTPEAGLSEMEDALQTYPDIDGLFMGSDQTGIGAAQAIKAAGKAGEIVFVTGNCQEASIALIEDGTISATVAQSSVTMGEWGIRACVAALEGKADQLVKEYYTPLHVINKSNVASFQYEGVTEPPKGWNMKK